VIDFSKFGEIETIRLSRIKRITATNLHRSWLNLPHVTYNEEVDITELEAFRQSMKEELAKDGIRITPLAFQMKAIVSALRAFPPFNSSLEEGGENLLLKKYYNIGVAVDTPEGLVVPVIKEVDKKGVIQLAQELGEISKRARNKKLMPAEMQGGSFTISSLGGIGGTSFTPIINAPEVAIMGVCQSRIKPVWNGSEFEPKLLLPLSLSYDHRVIDGAEAARFVAHVGNMLNDVRRLLL
jgi:pyruvate dehydrogenase E2 component (dihydrolipoamide acetyltransferase)